jgi:hypothetical protein
MRRRGSASRQANPRVKQTFNYGGNRVLTASSIFHGCVRLFPKHVDGRIDDESRVEGKGAVDDFRLASDFHLEGGKENRPKAIKIQLRPDPLAR